MRFLSISFIFMSTVSVAVSAQQSQLGKTAVKDVVRSMSIEEKARLLVGTGMPGWVGLTQLPDPPKMKVPGSAGKNQAFPEYHIPELILADGPAGLRIRPERESSTRKYYATAFPVATALASSWNPELVKEIGHAIGNETKEYGVDLLLAPGMNIQRNPLNGRNFEYFSEDPLISGTMASAYVNGVQSNGVGATLKHFAANNQESNRFGVNEHISQRALREIYLKGFEIAVKNAQPWAIMTSYNKINGVYASENKDLLTGILRDEWKFGGLVMTDWFGGYGSEDEVRANKVSDVAAQINAGNDWLMPGTPQQVEAVVRQVKSGKLKKSAMDESAGRILKMIVQSPVFRNYAYSDRPDLKAHAQIARQAAAESMVLLENKNNSLPVKLNGKNIALFGNTSYNFISGGTGSGDVNEAYVISLREGLKNVGSEIDHRLSGKYMPYIRREDSLQTERRKREGGLSKYIRIREMDFSDQEILQASEENDFAIFTIGRNAGESGDRPVSDFYLQQDEQSMIEKISRAFHGKNKKFIIIMNIGGVIETQNWKDLADAVLLSWQPGQEAGDAVAEILSGKVNPSGKLAQTFPRDYKDVPSAGSFPGTPAGFPVNSIYNEGIYVGYRYYDTFHVPVAYPFGYGLSYSSFTFSELEAKDDPAAKMLHVSFTITNSGKVPGKEVAQVYISAPKGSLDHPVQELKSFMKTEILKPGKSQTFSVSIPYYDLASFNPVASSWEMEAGNYEVRLGNSSQHIMLKNSFSIPGRMTILKTGNLMKPDMKFQEIKN
ncbi:glycoside hydrolase family 3 protein [uncultured Chryseobacterium sp.]|uniref:beta-glucosidase n=1 Tax=uncultured Chryseobacterium sp. TaxID=259322 RepID=UPI0025F0A34B|nr:glycoside hydrolase family 3 protein [uncultured Chryseobacterium sp.]